MYMFLTITSYLGVWQQRTQACERSGERAGAASAAGWRGSCGAAGAAPVSGPRRPGSAFAPHLGVFSRCLRLPWGGAGSVSAPPPPPRRAGNPHRAAGLACQCQLHMGPALPPGASLPTGLCPRQRGRAAPGNSIAGPGVQTHWGAVTFSGRRFGVELGASIMSSCVATAETVGALGHCPGVSTSAHDSRHLGLRDGTWLSSRVCSGDQLG